jgi:DNA polymerase I
MDFDEFVADAEKNGVFSFDIEHEYGKSWREPNFNILGCSIFTKGNGPHYLTDLDAVKSILPRLFEKSLPVGHNVKYDLICLRRAGILDALPETIADTLSMFNLLDESVTYGGESGAGLKELVFKIFGHKMTEYQLTKKELKNNPELKQAKDFAHDSEEFAEYAKQDAYWTLRLYYNFLPQLENEGVIKYFERIMMPALLAFCDLELSGIGFDIGHSIKCFEEFTKVRDKLSEEIFRSIGKLDLNSSQQLSKRLFDELGYSTKHTEKGKNGFYCTDSSVLEAMAGKYPACKMICIYRTCEKMISTYLTASVVQCNKNFDKRLRGKFSLESKTSRTKCSDVNLQNFPVARNMDQMLQHINIRKCFVSGEGKSFIVADFSNIELRLFGKISGDKTFIRYFREWECTECKSKGESDTILHFCPKCGIKENEAALKGKCKGFWHGKDLHQNTADKIEVLEGDRQKAKIANFSLIFGILASTLAAREPVLSVRQWQRVIDGFMDEYKGVRPYHARQESAMKQQLFVKDIFGRKRRFKRKEIEIMFKHCLNIAFNTPTQGSATGLSLRAMADIRKFFMDQGTWMKKITTVNMIHDEFVIEVDDDYLDFAHEKVVNIMENCIKVGIPIRVDTHIVKSWGDAK